MELVIVESPAKASTIKKYLGKNYTVKATIGHIKDLPKEKLGVDVENNFSPQYITIKGKGKVLKELRDMAKKADKIYLAPDPDREGEAIAWHIANEIRKKGSDNIYRVMFNEITKKAVNEAINHPTKIDENKVNAQQARRILDRLVGYKISPLLWKKVRRGLSAGRVQSVALRLVCEREREIEAFKPEEYWSITANLEGASPPPFDAKLFKIDGKKAELSNQEETDSLLKGIEGEDYKVTSIQKKERKKNPVPPFITSTLQQEASRKLRFSAKKTMMIAQRLYEGIDIGKEGAAGLITYMRTDSFRLADEALAAVRGYIESKYGKDYLPGKPNTYKSKKSAQEGHEAIRPTSMENDPQKIKDFLSKEEFALYDLIWNRVLASQMTPAILDVTTVDATVGKAVFRANGMVMRFPGFTRIYSESTEAKEGDDGGDRLLPSLNEGETLKVNKITPKQHFTQPPPRYSEAALIRELEDKGIGRPSTYASIMSTILNREYISLLERRLHPSKLGLLVTELLTDSFPDILNVAFTAKMEEELDRVETGNKEWVGALKDFYQPFTKDLERAEVEMKNIKATVEETTEVCEKCGKTMVIKWGKFGRFLACSGYPECKNTKQINEEGGKLEIEEPEKTGEICDKCGAEMVLKRGRFGKFLACSRYPDCKTTKPISLGVKCPNKGCEGEILEKRSKRGKVFYGCNQYPKCTFASWNKPINEKCPDCGHDFLVEKVSRGNEVEVRCPSKGCGYKKEPSESDQEAVNG